LPVDVVLGIYRRVVAHCEMPAGARIGPGLFLPHPEGVILSDKCRIGPEACVFQQVTLGCWKNQSPRVRARAAVFAGAKVIGGVTVGRGAGVGANAVVTRDVPARHIATGIPAVARPMRAEGEKWELRVDLGSGGFEAPDAMVFPGAREASGRMAQ
jgi:serine O-acetyltransferase